MRKREITKTPIDIEKIKKHLRIFSDCDNEYIEDLANDAVAYIEDRIGENISVYKNTITGVFSKNMIIEMPKLDRILSVKNNGVLVDTYETEENGIRVTADLNNAEIIYTEKTTNMKFIKQTINLVVANWYENRENPGAESKAEASLSALIGLYSNPVK